MEFLSVLCGGLDAIRFKQKPLIQVCGKNKQIKQKTSCAPAVSTLFWFRSCKSSPCCGETTQPPTYYQYHLNPFIHPQPGAVLSGHLALYTRIYRYTTSEVYLLTPPLHLHPPCRAYEGRTENKHFTRGRTHTAKERKKTNSSHRVGERRGEVQRWQRQDKGARVSHTPCKRGLASAGLPSQIVFWLESLCVRVEGAGILQATEGLLIWEHRRVIR